MNNEFLVSCLTHKSDTPEYYLIGENSITPAKYSEDSPMFCFTLMQEELGSHRYTRDIYGNSIVLDLSSNTFSVVDESNSNVSSDKILTKYCTEDIVGFVIHFLSGSDNSVHLNTMHFCPSDNKLSCLLVDHGAIDNRNDKVQDVLSQEPEAVYIQQTFRRSKERGTYYNDRALFYISLDVASGLFIEHKSRSFTNFLSCYKMLKELLPDYTTIEATS